MTRHIAPDERHPDDPTNDAVASETPATVTQAPSTRTEPSEPDASPGRPDPTEPHSGPRRQDRPSDLDGRELAPARQPDPRQPQRWRQRTVLLRRSERTALNTLGTFRTVTVEDLARFAYDGKRGEMDTDLKHLEREGLVQRSRIAGATSGDRARMQAVVALSREGHALVCAAPESIDQTLHWGFVKPQERAHDAAIYRLYQAEASRITHAGGAIRRVILDAELKGWVASDRNRHSDHLGHSDANRHLNPNRRNDADGPNDRNSHTDANDRKDMDRHAEMPQYSRVAAVADAYNLRVVDGTIQIPDLRIEYDTAEGDRCHVDLELATAHYKPGQIAAKARAGFVIYAPSSQTTRLRAVLEERGLIAEILAF